MPFLQPQHWTGIHLCPPKVLRKVQAGGRTRIQRLSKEIRRSKHHAHFRMLFHIPPVPSSYLGTQSGIFSAMTSGFILNIQDDIKPDFNEETVALLHVLIYKIDGTIFGSQTPPPPSSGLERSQPRRRCLPNRPYTSLGISLLAAFLATLGKQRLNRFGKAKVRGFETDESRNRQPKLIGMVSW